MERRLYKPTAPSPFAASPIESPSVHHLRRRHLGDRLGDRRARLAQDVPVVGARRQLAPRPTEGREADLDGIDEALAHVELHSTVSYPSFACRFDLR